VPNSYIKNPKKLNLWISNINFDGLVLSGGNDIRAVSKKEMIWKNI
jgi:hypothetical protein